MLKAIEGSKTYLNHADCVHHDYSLTRYEILQRCVLI